MTQQTYTRQEFEAHLEATIASLQGASAATEKALQDRINQLEQTLDFRTKMLRDNLAAAEEKGVMLDAIESISSELGLKFRVEFDTDRGDWLVQACSADELEWYTGADTSFQGAVQSLLNTLNEVFFEE